MTADRSQDNTPARMVYVRNVRSGLIVPASFKPGFATVEDAEAWIAAAASDPFAPVPASEFVIEEVAA